MSRSTSIFRTFAVALIAVLVLFPAVTRLRQIGVPQNPASFSGVHRSGVMPSSPELAVPEDTAGLVPPEPVSHPADSREVRYQPTITVALDSSGLRAPPAVFI